jgi:hypothetical protein
MFANSKVIYHVLLSLPCLHLAPYLSVRSYKRFLPPKQGLEKVLNTTFAALALVITILLLPPVAFPRNFFISREAAIAEQRYEKERQSVNYVHTAAFSARTRVFSPLIALPLSHPPPINAIRGAGLRLFPPPPHTP